MVHTVCHRFYHGLRRPPKQLKSAYSSALLVCDELTCAGSIVFISMGTGIYKWPPALAAKIAVTELVKSRFDKTLMRFTSENLSPIYEGELAKHQHTINKT